MTCFIYMDKYVYMRQETNTTNWCDLDCFERLIRDNYCNYFEQLVNLRHLRNDETDSRLILLQDILILKLYKKHRYLSQKLEEPNSLARFKHLD